MPGLGFRGSLLAYGEEVTWGVPVARTDLVCMNSDGLTVTEEEIKTACKNARYFDIDEIYRGKITAGGDTEIDVRYEGMETFIKHALGSVVSTEQASIVITSANKWMDIKEDAGGELNASIVEATYPIGTADTDVGSLCEAVKTALEAAGAGTYTVTYSRTTKKFTIAVSGAIAAVEFLWKTGTHGSDNANDSAAAVLGFDNLDTGSAASQVSDNTVDSVYLNAFKIVDTFQVGLTLEKLIDSTLATGQSALYSGAKVNTLDFSLEPGGLLTSSISFIAKDETMLDVETVTSIITDPKEHAIYHQAVITYNAVDEANVKAFSFTFNNNFNDDRTNLGSQLIDEAVPTTKIEVTGTFTIEFANRAKYDDFRNNTTRDVILKLTGSTIQGGKNFEIEFKFNYIKLMGSTPQIEDEGLITVEIPFNAYAEDSTLRELEINIQNTVFAT